MMIDESVFAEPDGKHLKDVLKLIKYEKDKRLCSEVIFVLFLFPLNYIIIITILPSLNF